MNEPVEAAEDAQADNHSGASPETAPHPDGAEGAPSPQQGEMPFAVVAGKAVTELPTDLYIPPARWKCSWKPSRVHWTSCST